LRGNIWNRQSGVPRNIEIQHISTTPSIAQVNSFGQYQSIHQQPYQESLVNVHHPDFAQSATSSEGNKKSILCFKNIFKHTMQTKFQSDVERPVPSI
jgi:hypothetical protein